MAVALIANLTQINVPIEQLRNNTREVETGAMLSTS